MYFTYTCLLIQTSNKCLHSELLMSKFGYSNYTFVLNFSLCFFYNNSQVTRQENEYDSKTVYYLKLLKIYSLSVIFCTFPATIVHLLQSTESCVSLKKIKHKVKHKIT